MYKKLNILFLSSWYPNRTDIFTGNFVRRHAEAVSETCNVNVLHASSDDKCKKKYEVETLYNGAVRETIVYYKKLKHSIPLISHLQKLMRYRKALKIGYDNIHENFKTDLIHLNVTFPAGIFALYLKKKYGLHYLITEHWTVFLESDPTSFPRGSKRIIKRILKNASVICPVSADLGRAIKKLSPCDKYQVVKNVVNTSLFSIKDKKNKKKKILHVSSLVDEQKNISGILRSIKKLNERRNDFQMLIVGDGDINPYKQYAKQLKINSNTLIFKGKQSIEEIAGIMKDSDVFLLFSNYENLPCVIIEAHASGLPVISSDVGGISEMINDENGILVNAGDENSLLESLDIMLNKLPDYNKKDIRKKAIEQYSYETIGKQFLTLYKHILK